MRLGTSFYNLPTLTVAKKLLGKLLVRQLPEGIAGGWIVEVEAYLWRDDPACHASRGRTKSNQSMFLPAGSLYVYPIHAKFCMNIVTEKEGLGAAVLIRAIQPTLGISLMQQRRPDVTQNDLVNGPGKLCKALDIDRQLDGCDLVHDERIWIEEAGTPLVPFRIARSSRIGISQGQEKQWRYFIDGNRYVSGRTKDHSIPKKQTLSESDL